MKSGENDRTDTNTAPIATRASEDLPIYYNSEPSSQPPQYTNEPSTQAHSGLSVISQATISKLGPQNHYSAQVATVSAILASPYVDLDAQRRADRKNKTLRERWKDFKERNFSEYGAGRYGKESYGEGSSADEWNVQGGRLAGGLTTPYRRAPKK
ncbi:hypothetical protein T440DRAFT_397703 [Plenodomus tracheiphilus IPT5]|uniref:Uncharacterized protein n=1 Tax=Plenodomus tracheiphilus IPT5 TaxID=1408161 RepID=A0A6A7B5W5_9PLEO|nr:hypothetical protein T440DRAFT_397703 [Plenodomus tracheiphilus IPT5]